MLRFAQSLTADRVTDPELDSLFVARSIELFKSYAKVKADSGTGRESLQIDHLSREQIDELRVHVDFVATKLLMAANAGTDGVDLREILRYLVNGNLTQVLGGTLASGYMRLIATRFKDGVLWKEFRGMVAKNEAAQPPPPGPS